MQKLILTIVFGLLLGGGACSTEPLVNLSEKINIIDMNIISSAFNNNEKIPTKYTCDGDNINPPLTFSEIPEETKSLVLIVDDPDAPAGLWTHWTLANILPSTNNINENSVPETAIEGLTSFGRSGWGSPCPPKGTHRYFFRLYALDTVLNLNKNFSVKELNQNMADHILTKAELIGLYSR